MSNGTWHPDVSEGVSSLADIYKGPSGIRSQKTDTDVSEVEAKQVVAAALLSIGAKVPDTLEMGHK